MADSPLHRLVSCSKYHHLYCRYQALHALVGAGQSFNSSNTIRLPDCLCTGGGIGSRGILSLGGLPFATVSTQLL